VTPLAPHIGAFLRERLPIECRASEHTCDTYAYAFQLLFEFAAKRKKTRPSALHLEDIDAPLVLAFLQSLERDRHNTVVTRNCRLAAIKSFMRFLEHREPAALDQIRRVLAIPKKKTDTRLVGYLTRPEMQAVLDAVNPTSRSGARDRAMLLLGFAGGLRVSELIGLRVEDVILHPDPCVFVRGKGRKERSLPLWKETVQAIRAWIKVRPPGTPELFLNANGAAMARSGLAYVLRQHVLRAAKTCASLRNKRVSPHTLRHTCAMMTLQATHDIRKVSLWLGHASIMTTEIYTRVDPTEKLEAIEAVIPPWMRRGRFKAPDKLLAALRAR
jgi:site-specific recombinase XerD